MRKMMYSNEEFFDTSSLSDISYSVSEPTSTDRSQGDLHDVKLRIASVHEIDQEYNEEIHLQEPKSASFPKRIREFGWWWEVLSAILAIICTTHMTAILLAMDNRPLHDWKFSFIQPNSLVSVFSTIAKSALLVPLAEGLGQLKWIYFENASHNNLYHLHTFDAASRGPWGALRFLWDIKGRAAIATLGSVSIILLLGFEPFVQQVIRYTTKPHLQQDSNGTVSVSYAWSELSTNVHTTDWTAWNYLKESLVSGGTSALLDQPFGTFSNTICPTTDCRIPEYDSLAVCSRCEDQLVSNDKFDFCEYGFRSFISSKNMTPTPHEIPRIFSRRDEFIGYLDKISANTSAPGEAQMYCEKQLPGFPPLQFFVRSFRDLEENPMNNIAILFTKLSTGFYSSTPAIPTQNGKWSPDDFRFCSFKDPLWTLGEKEPPRYADDTFLPSRQKRKVPTTDPQKIISIMNSTCFASTTDLRLYNDITNFGQINGTLTQCQLEYCAKKYSDFEVTFGQAHAGSKTSLPLILNDIQQNSSDVYDYQFRAQGIQNKNFTIIVNETMVTSLGLLFQSVLDESNVGIYHFSRTKTNFRELFDRFADVLTTIVQSPLNSATRHLTLNTYSPVTYVNVRWPWMIMPLLLVVVSVAFLGLTMYESKKRPYLFKTSIFAVLSTGGDVWYDTFANATGRANGKVTYRHLEKMAKTKEAVFAKDEYGLLKLKKD